MKADDERNDDHHYDAEHDATLGANILRMIMPSPVSFVGHVCHDDAVSVHVECDGGHRSRAQCPGAARHHTVGQRKLHDVAAEDVHRLIINTRF